MSLEIAKDPETIAKIKQELYHIINELELSLSVTDHAKIAIGNFNEVELEELLKKFHDNLSEVQGNIKDEENKKRIRRLQSIIANISMRINQILANRYNSNVKISDNIASENSTKDIKPPQNINKMTPTINNIKNFVNNIVDRIAPSINKEVIVQQVKSDIAKAEINNPEVRDEIPVTQTKIETDNSQEITSQPLIDTVVRNIIEAISSMVKVKPPAKINQALQNMSRFSNRNTEQKQSKSFSLEVSSDKAICPDCITK